MKAQQKPPRALEAKTIGDKLEIHWEKIDLKQFRKVLSAELADGTNKVATSCTSSDPNLIDKVVRVHLNESSYHSTQRLQTKRAPKREHDSKRAITQAEATAHFK